jgi:hypothetical protein
MSNIIKQNWLISRRHPRRHWSDVEIEKSRKAKRVSSSEQTVAG